VSTLFICLILVILCMLAKFELVVIVEKTPIFTLLGIFGVHWAFFRWEGVKSEKLFFTFLGFLS
jgi:hypothetical protein